MVIWVRNSADWLNICCISVQINSKVDLSHNMCDMFPDVQYIFSKTLFKISMINSKVTSEPIHGDCDILNAAIARYPKRIFPPAAAHVYSHLDPSHRKKRRRMARKEMKTDTMLVSSSDATFCLLTRMMFQVQRILGNCGDCDEQQKGMWEISLHGHGWAL